MRQLILACFYYVEEGFVKSKRLMSHCSLAFFFGVRFTPPCLSKSCIFYAHPLALRRSFEVGRMRNCPLHLKRELKAEIELISRMWFRSSPVQIAPRVGWDGMGVTKHQQQR